MRTYAHLIQFPESTTLQLGLIPANDGKTDITFERFAKFIAPFAELDDIDVAARYHYGELRLAGLNWLIRFILKRLIFHHVDRHWGSTVGDFLAPFLTVFLLLAAILSAMQVELAAQDLTMQDRKGAIYLARGCQGFSIAVVAFTVAVVVVSVGVVVFGLIHDLIFNRRLVR
jgi:hypothetical protein